MVPAILQTPCVGQPACHIMCKGADDARQKGPTSKELGKVLIS